MKKFLKWSSLGMGSLLVALVGITFASRAEDASSALKAVNSALYNQSLTPITYIGYQQKLHAGMSTTEIQEQFRDKGRLFGGASSVSFQEITAPLATNFTGYLKLHDGCCGNFGDCGSTWLVMDFEQGKLKTSSLWFNTF
ncbi:hypothetical protein [Armatimonas sp.]|uniref:hypothetical protein n=1 Tax=Armatimonas sp. TaxID=1872638 RepID=UPI00286D24A4|nr:hypothetical protein [Armatimonas sp.]